MDTMLYVAAGLAALLWLVSKLRGNKIDELKAKLKVADTEKKDAATEAKREEVAKGLEKLEKERAESDKEEKKKSTKDFWKKRLK